MEIKLSAKEENSKAASFFKIWMNENEMAAPETPAEMIWARGVDEAAGFLGLSRSDADKTDEGMAQAESRYLI